MQFGYIKHTHIYRTYPSSCKTETLSFKVPFLPLSTTTNRQLLSSVSRLPWTRETTQFYLWVIYFIHIYFPQTHPCCVLQRAIPLEDRIVSQCMIHFTLNVCLTILLLVDTWICYKIILAVVSNVLWAWMNKYLFNMLLLILLCFEVLRPS